MRKKIAFIVPFYNEGDGCQNFFDRIFPEVVEKLDYDIDIVCIDDGSLDNTLDILRENANRTSSVKVISLSRNFGKEAAVTAGLVSSDADLYVVMDSDFQEPPAGIILQMVKKWEISGKPVVLTKRIDRNQDSFLKRITAGLFYKLMGKISDVRMMPNVGDSRLMERKVVDAFNTLPESQRFLRGLFSWVGFDSEIVEFVRPVREIGSTKYNFLKMWNLALDAITSFSTFPLKMWTYFGVFISMSSFVYGISIIIKALVIGGDVPGYPSMMVVILFLSGVQMMGLGVIGEYLSRTYIESKNRPAFIIAEKINFDK